MYPFVLGGTEEDIYLTNRIHDAILIFTFMYVYASIRVI